MWLSQLPMIGYREITGRIVTQVGLHQVGWVPGCLTRGRFRLPQYQAGTEEVSVFRKVSVQQAGMSRRGLNRGQIVCRVGGPR